jgi:hypothetical protein
MIQLQPGDCFVVKTDSKLAGLVNWGQALWSHDNRAEFNHAGIVVKEDGTTFESLSRIGHYYLGRYAGSRILVVRYGEMIPERFWFGYGQVKRYDGKLYPFWRLPLHLVNVAKFIHWTHPVCSELVGRFLNAAGITPNTGWGTTPDDWADLWREMIRNDARKLTVVCDGVLTP